MPEDKRRLVVAAIVGAILVVIVALHIVGAMSLHAR
jgi:hypothetical protein